MRTQALRCAIALLAGWAVSCEAATQLDSSDDMTGMGGAGQSPSGTASCAACFETACGWQAADCAGDPECARWITCAEACGPDSSDTPSRACLQGCPAPSTPTGVQLRDTLTACFGHTGGCCADSGKSLDGGAETDDAAPTGTWDGDGQAGGGGGVECVGTTCKACLVSAMSNASECAAAEPGCAEAVTACMTAGGVTGGPLPEHGDCANFMVTFAACAADKGLVQHTVDQCVWVVPPAAVENTLDVVGCSAELCGICSSEELRGCLTCQANACRIELGALLGDADAQALYWCLRQCAADGDPATCRSTCGAEHPNGVPVLTVLNQCASASCAAQCAN